MIVGARLVHFVVSTGRRATCHVVRSTIVPAIQSGGKGYYPGDYVAVCGQRIEGFSFDAPDDPMCRLCLRVLTELDARYLTPRSSRRRTVHVTNH